VIGEPKPTEQPKKKNIILRAFDILDAFLSGTPNIDHDRVSISSKPLREASEHFTDSEHYLSELKQEKQRFRRN
jgi:hypothetical protein